MALTAKHDEIGLPFGSKMPIVAMVDVQVQGRSETALAHAAGTQEHSLPHHEPVVGFEVSFVTTCEIWGDALLVEPAGNCRDGISPNFRECAQW